MINLTLRDDPYPALFVSEQQKGREKINLGHASIQVTMTYTHVVDENLHQVYRLKYTVIRAS